MRKACGVQVGEGMLLFVLGKGGVGRTSVATGLAVHFAARGERTLVVQWAVADEISRQFGRPPTAHEEQRLAPNLSTINVSAEETLREYFVEHLGLRLLYRAVVRNRQVRRLTRAIPGLEELLFLGRLFWVTTLRRDYDQVVVDAPALGHGVSLFGVPAASRSLGLGGLLGKECERVQAMLDDPARSGAIVVTTAEELAVEETLEFLPRLSRELHRPPLFCVVNRSVAALGPLPLRASECDWFAALGAPGLERAYARLAQRDARERMLRDRLRGMTVVSVPERVLGAEEAIAWPI